ncbi:MAG TPA: exopolysaccharide biosynthesis protein [Limnobacter sp.]|nr:exopolysaccharide biosynthesis protein [Limnobacter sp.]
MNDLLLRLKTAVEHPHDNKVSVRFLADMHGESAHGALLLFLAVLTLLPIPFSGFVFSVGIWSVARMMWINNSGHGLPESVCRVTLSSASATRLIRILNWIYTRADRICTPRLESLSSPKHRGWLVPFIALMGFIIFLPIPGGNGTPAVALILIGLGLMARDGLAIVAGIVTGLVGLGVLVFLIWMIVVTVL